MGEPLPGTCKDTGLINPEELVGRVTEVSPGIFRYMMPYFSGAVSLYAIVDNGEVLLVDTGDTNEGGPELLLDYLGVSPADVSVFVTHHHADHMGRAAILSSRGARVLMSETVYTEDDTALGLLRHMGVQDSVEVDLLTSGIEGVMDFCGVGQTGFSHTTISPGDEIHVGRRVFRVVRLTGHSPEGVGLFEEASRILFPGDEVLNGITPAVASCKFGLHTMENYRRGLELARRLAPNLTLPGHLTAMMGPESLNAAIDAISARYQKMMNRFAASMEASFEGPMSVIDLARLYYSNLDGGFDSQNKHERASRLVKVISYVEKLVDDGRIVQSVDESGTVYYSRP